ncbi:hypothetical protein GXW82_25305 [Streptacidiphilus sp. 4-A2]|nr:hypothetical protein [Streptacidiphilus sp. 4-A2]
MIMKIAAAGTSPGARSTRRWISGWPPRSASRCSNTAKTPNSSTPAANITQPQTGQCSWWPSTSGTTSSPMAAASSTSPTRSRLRPGLPGKAGSSLREAAARASPIGTFTRKTGRQLEPSKSALTSTRPGPARPDRRWPAPPCRR